MAGRHINTATNVTKKLSRKNVRVPAPLTAFHVHSGEGVLQDDPDRSFVPFNARNKREYSERGNMTGHKEQELAFPPFFFSFCEPFLLSRFG